MALRPPQNEADECCASKLLLHLATTCPCAAPILRRHPAGTEDFHLQASMILSTPRQRAAFRRPKGNSTNDCVGTELRDRDQSRGERRPLRTSMDWSGC